MRLNETLFPSEHSSTQLYKAQNLQRASVMSYPAFSSVVFDWIHLWRKALIEFRWEFNNFPNSRGCRERGFCPSALIVVPGMFLLLSKYRTSALFDFSEDKRCFLQL